MSNLCPIIDIIRDLVPDLESLFDKHRSVKPYLIRKDLAEQNLPTGEYFQSEQELVNYIQFAYCIKCGLVPVCLPDGGDFRELYRPAGFDSGLALLRRIRAMKAPRNERTSFIPATECTAVILPAPAPRCARKAWIRHSPFSWPKRMLS